MSKSAVYAGLAQGLMSFGQGAGRAMELTAMETMREQNLQQNWARQDRMRTEDREYNQQIRTQDANNRTAERTEDRGMQQQQIDATKANNKALMDLRVDDQKDKVSQRTTKDTVVTEDGFDYRVQFNGKGEEISREIVAGAGQFNKSDKMPEKIKIQLGILETELRSLIEYGSGDEQRAMEVRSEIDSLLGKTKTDVNTGAGDKSTLPGYSVEQVISKLMEANPNISKLKAMQLAKSKGYIQ